jgi:hypothetical protein
MTKYEWTKAQVETATAEFQPEDRTYIDAFLAEIAKAGEELTRTQFEEIFEAGSPPDEVDAGYFDYNILSDHFVLVADFSEAWDISESTPLPRVSTKANFGDVALPDDFCSLGGTPEWIQNEKYPICPKCDGDMVLFLQLKSIPYEITKNHEELEAYPFGDAGNFYLFHCTNCGTHQTSWECY